MPNLLHKQAAQAHELGLPCVICELLFVKFTLCIYPFHVCKFDVLDCGSSIYHVAIKKHNLVNSVLNSLHTNEIVVHCCNC